MSRLWLVPPPQSCSEREILLRKLRSGEIPDPAGIIKLVDELDLQSNLAREQLDAEWVAYAQGALAKNKSTFSVLSMNNVKSATGYIAKLKELGYTVEEPE